LLAANKRKAEREQSERSRKDETEKQAKEDRRRMIAEYDDLEEREAARVKAEVVQALVSSPASEGPSMLTSRRMGRKIAQERSNAAR